MEVRKYVVDWMLEHGRVKSAVRYACCGLADQLMKSENGVTVRARGCGHPMCPRCGKRSAGRFIHKVNSWLAYEEHGDLVNVCFTQSCKPGESVASARRRLHRKTRMFFQRLTTRGITAGVCVDHAVWSQKRGGWHYHTHAVLEFAPGALELSMSETLGELWYKQLVDLWFECAGSDTVTPLFNKPLLAAGPMIEGLREDSGDSEFWNESKDEVARVVQYPFRDLAQGIAGRRLGGTGDEVKERVRELLDVSRGWKMRRCIGKWRKVCPASKETKNVTGEEEDGSEKAAPAAPAKPIGKVRVVWRRAKMGEAWAREAMMALERTCRHNSNFARRLVAYVRRALAPPGAT